MSDSTTLSIRLSAETKEQLAELAERTRHTCSFLAAEAIADFVERELATIEKVARGQADVRAGHITPHDEVTGAARTVIKAARTRQ